nr:hypothetical protein [Wadden Sea poxvirus]
MLMYSKRTRKALSNLISNKLKIDKISQKYLHILLEFGLHGNLPAFTYDKAIQVDVCNIRFLPPDTIRINDIVETLKIIPIIDERLYNIIMINKKKLLTSGSKVIKLMIEYKLLTKNDINWIISENILDPVQVLKIDPLTASLNMKISHDDIIDVIQTVPSTFWNYLYNNLNISLNTLLYLSDNMNIPPLNKSLMKLDDINVAIYLVNKYPHDSVIDYISNKIKHNINFINEMHKTISRHFPTLIPSINDLLFLTIPRSELIRLYGIKTVAMFSFNIPIDIYSLSKEDTDFIKKNITFYDSMCWKTAIKFRDEVMKKEHYVITMNTKKLLPTVKHYSITQTNIEELLNHINNVYKYQKIRLSDVKKIISNFQLNPCTVRNVMLSNVDKEIKIMALKIIKQWKSYNLSLTSTFTKNNGDIIMDIIDYMSLKILQNYTIIFNNLKTLDGNIIPYCACLKCINSNQKKLYNINIDENSNDSDLITCLYDLIRLVLHGKINIDIIGYNRWGPLNCLLEGSRLIKKQDIGKLLSLEKIKYDNTADPCNLISLLTTPSYKLVNVYDSLNEKYSKVVILFNVIIEYMMFILIYRVSIIQKNNNIIEFTSTIVNTVLEASGIYFYNMKIHDLIEIEIDELLKKGMIPIYLLHLFLKIALIILEDINGTC